MLKINNKKSAKNDIKSIKNSTEYISTYLSNQNNFYKVQNFQNNNNIYKNSIKNRIQNGITYNSTHTMANHIQQY